MSSRPFDLPARDSLLGALVNQCRVISALMLRELHTRYGRDNVGYLWMVGEPMMLASVIGLMHFSAGGHTAYAGDIQAVPFSIIGYTTFILFRGIVNRAEGTLEGNAPLLYHRQVTVFDITVARALLEFAGTFLTFVFIMSLLICMGLANPPARPLLVIAAWGYMLWYSWGHSLVIAAISYENRTIGRLTHPYAYFMMGLSASFFQVGWMPHPIREILTWIPLTSIFELVRHGWFDSADTTYFFGLYLTASCLLLTWAGLVLVSRMRSRVHLS